LERDTSGEVELGCKVEWAFPKPKTEFCSAEAWRHEKPWYPKEFSVAISDTYRNRNLHIPSFTQPNFISSLYLRCDSDLK